MKKDSMKFYKLEESKAKITFNDTKKKKNNSLLIIRNSIICGFILIIMFAGFTFYATIQINSLSANAYKSNININETMNKYANNLNTTNVNYNKKYEVLINKVNPIPENVDDLYTQVSVKDNFYQNVKIEEKTYKNYKMLKKVMENKGYYINIKNGYKSFEELDIEYSKYIHKKGTKYTLKHIPTPEISEYRTGLAIDISIASNKNSNSNYKSDEYKYLQKISYLYGFIIRYPKGKEKITGYEYAPYHLRYVGKDLAKYLTRNNLTLEEYYKE